MKSSILRRLSLGVFLSLLSSSLWALDSQFQQGYEAFARRDYAAASLALANAKSAAGHSLRDYYLWALGRSRLEQGDVAGGLKLLEELVSQESESLWLAPAKIQIARGLRERGEIPESKRRLEELLPALPDAWKGEALLQLGLTEAAAGNKEAAQQRFRELEVDYPASAAADRLAEERGKLAMTAPALSAAEQLRQADRLFEAKAYTEALGAYDAVLQRGAESNAVARVKKGECLYALRRYGPSLPYLEPGAGVPADLARSALLHRGMSLLRSGDEAGSVAQFEKVQSRRGRGSIVSSRHDPAPSQPFQRSGGFVRPPGPGLPPRKFPRQRTLGRGLDGLSQGRLADRQALARSHAARRLRWRDSGQGTLLDGANRRA
jgi:tetratricopeptide (TPR) repeat protein